MAQNLNSIMEIKACMEKLPDGKNLYIGDFNFDPTQREDYNAWKVARNRQTKDGYGMPLGNDTLRDKVAEEYGLERDNIAIVNGGMQAYSLLLELFADKGREIIVPNPGWEAYGAPTKRPVLKCELKRVDYSTLENILNAVSTDTRAVVVNSPENPTGKIYSFKMLEQLAAKLYEMEKHLILDEVYCKTVYDGRTIRSCAELIKDYPNVIGFDSASKRFGFTDERIGWIYGDKSIIESLPNLKRGIDTCAPTNNQTDVLWCLEHQKELLPWIIGILKKRRDLLYNYLSKIDGMQVQKPEATIYFWPNISKICEDDKLVARRLIDEKHVGTVPGSLCGSLGGGHLRISFSGIGDTNLEKTSDPEIEEAGKRVVDFFNFFK
jgi:aspartate/methionine/tyrosine aminotransferase